MKIEIQLKETSKIITHYNVINAYTKGSFYCVYEEGEIVYKYPLNNIWRVREDY